MKVRTGFVSNSSSSSFIVAIDGKKAKTKVTISFDVDLDDYADRRITTIKKLNDYYDEYYGEREFMYEECRKAIEEGKTVLVGSFTDECGEAEEVFLCDNGLKGNIPEDSGIEIIHSEGGY